MVDETVIEWYYGLIINNNSYNLTVKNVNYNFIWLWSDITGEFSLVIYKFNLILLKISFHIRTTRIVLNS